MEMNEPPAIPANVAKWLWPLYLVLSTVLAYMGRDAGPLAPYQWYIGLGVAVLGAVLGVATPALVSSTSKLLPVPWRRNGQ